MTTRHVLILGGTGEARAIAAGLAAIPALRVTSSLAGRTAAPLLPVGETRTGGFGGVDGLVRWIGEHAVDLVIDATHPFAARISANAEAAAARSGVPLVVFERSAWTPVAGDRWIDADDMEHAAALIGEAPRRVFLAVGRQDIAPFGHRPHHDYVVRSVEPISHGPLREAERILDRGPFDDAAEIALLRSRAIEIVVAKNSGGEATYGKIAAARALRLPVVMVRRPRPADPGAHATVEGIVAAVRHALGPLAERGE